MSKYLMQNARLYEAQAGIKIGGRHINNLRYVDVTAGNFKITSTSYRGLPWSLSSK